MALWLIGLGLHDPSDISVKGLHRVRAVAASGGTVYAEFYTAVLAGTDHAGLQDALGVDVRLLDRLGVEKGAARLVDEARTRDVVLLTAGDPLAATTHADLVLRARQAGVAVDVIHGASILSAAPGLLGLQHYKFGRTATLVRPEPKWSPSSPFEVVARNHEAGLHTLVLLDIKADEGYFMRANEGLRLLLEHAKSAGAQWFGEDAQVGVVARAGGDNLACTGPVGRLAATDFGPPLHCIVVPGAMQVVEQEAWNSLALPPARGL